TPPIHEMSFACPSCAKTWLQKEHRDQHVADTGHHVFQLNCNTCPRTFQSRQAVDQHMESLHRRKPLTVSSPGARFNCDLCGRRFKSQE
ncbi:hypothetical protein LY76DRAFT_480923, partial [Colletotrichum caudatum]